MHVGHHRIMAFAGWTSVDLNSRSACGQFLDIVCTRKIQTAVASAIQLCWRALLLDSMVASAKCPGFQVLCMDRNHAHLLPENRPFAGAGGYVHLGPGADCRHLSRLRPAFGSRDR
jgi:hypothetical protein